MTLDIQDILTKVLNSMLTTRIKITSVPQMNYNPGIKLINTIVPKAQIISEIYKLEFLFNYVLLSLLSFNQNWQKERKGLKNETLPNGANLSLIFATFPSCS